MSQGWIKLHRKFLKWEWWNDRNTSRLFLTLLLLANHEEARWQGMVVKRGELITGLKTLSVDTGLTIRSLRTCFERLKTTGELTYRTTSKFRIVTILKYEDYQSETTSKTTSKTSSERQANDKQTTTNNNNKNVKNDKKRECAFDEFWKAYPRHEAKKKAFDAFKKVDVDLQTLLSAIEVQKKTAKWQEQDGKFIPHPATWLNGQRWLDEITPTSAPPLAIPTTKMAPSSNY